MQSPDCKVRWCVNKAFIVLSLSDHIRRGRPRLCQGAEEQVQDQTLLCQAPTYGLPARPDDPGGRQLGNVRHAHSNRRKLGSAKTCSDLRLKLVSGLLWICCLYVGHSLWSVVLVAFDAGLCHSVFSLTVIVVSSFVKVLYFHLEKHLGGSQVHARNKHADVIQSYLHTVHVQDFHKINYSLTGAVCLCIVAFLSLQLVVVSLFYHFTSVGCLLHHTSYHALLCVHCPSSLAMSSSHIFCLAVLSLWSTSGQ